MGPLYQVVDEPYGASFIMPLGTFATRVEVQTQVDPVECTASDTLITYRSGFYRAGITTRLHGIRVNCRILVALILFEFD